MICIFFFRDAAFSSGLPLQNPTDHLSKVTNIENIIKNLVTFYQVKLKQFFFVVVEKSKLQFQGREEIQSARNYFMFRNKFKL